MKFLRKLDREFPQELDLHLIVDNYGTHTHPNVKKWLSRHRRFYLALHSNKLLVAEPGGALVR